MYLLFKNFSLVILFQLTSSKIKNVMPTPQACAVFPIIYLIYNSGQVNIMNNANIIQPQADKKLKL